MVVSLNADINNTVRNDTWVNIIFTCWSIIPFYYWIFNCNLLNTFALIYLIVGIFVVTVDSLVIKSNLCVGSSSELHLLYTNPYDLLLLSFKLLINNALQNWWHYLCCYTITTFFFNFTIIFKNYSVILTYYYSFSFNFESTMLSTN